MKIVINRRFGGFGLSNKAMREVADLKGQTTNTLDWWELERNDPALVSVVESLGAEANGASAELAVIEIPDDVEWEINEYDGAEWVAEKHRRWS